MTAPATIPPLEKPTPDDVATILRARTKDLTGTELGTFTADTRPTDTEVARIIDLAYAEVTGRCGLYIGSSCAAGAKSLVVIRAAAWVELSYFPEQVRSDRSVYAELVAQFDPGVQAVMDCVAGNVPDPGDADSNATFRFGALDVHGWTASPYYGAPEVPADDAPAPAPAVGEVPPFDHA
jgi:hypothetical protein